MINFIPNPTALHLGPIQIHWYGLCIIFGAVIGVALILRLARYYNISKELIYDYIFYAVVFGLLGARLYYVIYAFPYYVQHPLEIFFIWHGGLAIHGALIAGVLTTYWFCKKHNLITSFRGLWPKNPLDFKAGEKFFTFTDLIVIALLTGQIFGRWGNYFNQELYGTPTILPWGIPIDSAHRVAGFEGFTHFHPTFLYESLLNIIVLTGLLFIHWLRIKKQKQISAGLITSLYFISYGAIRIFTETLRIDDSPLVLGMRVGMLASILVCSIGIAVFIRQQYLKSKL